MHHPMCEASCANASRWCFAVYDRRPKCFCKEPKVRDQSTGRCLLKCECPKDSERLQEGSRARTTRKPTRKPTQRPTQRPTRRPTQRPTRRPTSRTPSVRPTRGPSGRPGPKTTKRTIPFPAPPKDFKCGPNEYVNNYAHKSCQPMCVEQPCLAIMDLTPKCFCKKPFKRDETNGRCVTQSRCPKDSSEKPRTSYFD